MPRKPKSDSRLRDYKLLAQEADEDSKSLLKSLGKPVRSAGKKCGVKIILCTVFTCVVLLIIGVITLFTLNVMYPGEGFDISGLKEMYEELINKNRTYYRNFTEEYTTDDTDLLLIPDSRNISTILNETLLAKNETSFPTTVLPLNETEMLSENVTTIGPLDGRGEDDVDLTLMEKMKGSYLWMENHVKALPLEILIPICIGMGLILLIPFIICCRRKIRRNRRRRLLGVLVTDLRSNEKNFAISDSSDDEDDRR